MSGLGIGSWNGGWLRVVRMEGVGAVWRAGVSTILSMIMVRAQWSMWLMSKVVIVAFVGCNCAVGERRRSKWSSGD